MLKGESRAACQVQDCSVKNAQKVSSREVHRVVHCQQTTFLKLQLLPVWLARTFIREEAGYLSLVFLRHFWDQTLKKGPRLNESGSSVVLSLSLLLNFFLYLSAFYSLSPRGPYEYGIRAFPPPPQSNLTKPDKSRSQRAGDGTGGGHA